MCVCMCVCVCVCVCARVFACMSVCVCVTFCWYVCLLVFMYMLYLQYGIVLHQETVHIILTLSLPVVWSREYGHTLSPMSHFIAFGLHLMAANDEVCTRREGVTNTVEPLYIRHLCNGDTACCPKYICRCVQTTYEIRTPL